MKIFNSKLFVVIATLLSVVFISCSKDSDEVTGTEYTINYNVDDVKGIKVDITIYEVDNNSKELVTKNMSDVKSGTSKRFKAQENTDHLLITYKWTIGAKTENHLVKEKFKLVKGKHTTINLNNNTEIL